MLSVEELVPLSDHPEEQLKVKGTLVLFLYH